MRRVNSAPSAAPSRPNRRVSPRRNRRRSSHAVEVSSTGRAEARPVVFFVAIWSAVATATAFVCHWPRSNIQKRQLRLPLFQIVATPSRISRIRAPGRCGSRGGGEVVGADLLGAGEPGGRTRPSGIRSATRKWKKKSHLLSWESSRGMLETLTSVPGRLPISACCPSAPKFLTRMAGVAVVFSEQSHRRALAVRFALELGAAEIEEQDVLDRSSTCVAGPAGGILKQQALRWGCSHSADPPWPSRRPVRGRLRRGPTRWSRRRRRRWGTVCAREPGR